MTAIDYAARVAKGVALLDVKWPEWAQEIDVDTLSISSGYGCVTAQYAGLRLPGESPRFTVGMAALGLTWGHDGTYVGYGFNAESEADDPDENGDYDQMAAYATLNALWKGVIAERRAAADTPTEGAS